MASQPPLDIEKAAQSTYTPHQHMSTQLEVFQVLLGISTPAEISGRHRVLPRATFTPTPIQPSRPRSSGSDSEQQRPVFKAHRLFFPPPKCNNIGLYQRAISEEWKNRVGFVISSVFINFLYLLQVLLAATFTALSAYQDASSVTLTVLGAINTVVAGILAWVKGQGMPNRFRKARDQYGAVVRSIEMTERMFSEHARLSTATDGEGKELDPRTEKERLEKMFDMARQDQQANYPDMYVSTTDKATTLEKIEEVQSGVHRSQAVVDARIEALVKELNELKGRGGNGTVS